jgi:hypothetical protein
MALRQARILAAVAAAVMALPLASMTSAAQTPQTDAEFDPPGTVYSFGFVPEDPVVERKRSIVPRHRAFLPARVDLTSRMPPIGNQGHLGACTAWATAYAARSYYVSALENRSVHEAANLPSPNYVFSLSRLSDNCDKGSTVGRVVEVLKNGALSLAQYPYSEKCDSPPPLSLVERASDFKVRGLTKVDVNHTDDIKGQLAKLNPVIISFKASTAWVNLRGKQVFTEREVPRDDKNQGGHAMTIVGYDDRLQAFRVMNSWGTRWGDRGFGWMSYDVFPSRINMGAWVLDVAGTVPGPLPTPSPTPTPVQPQLSELNTLSCARVDVEPRGNQSVLSGYVGSDDDLNRVKAIAASAPGTSVGNVIVAPWPQCEALQTLEKPLKVVERPTIDIGASTELRSGDPLRIRVVSPGQISYLYVSYIQADGSVIHLVQPKGLVPQPTLPRQTLTFGGGEQGQPKFTIGAPFGREMIIAIASRSPLFDHELPAHQTEREYLTELRRGLIYKPAPDMPDRELAATMTTLQTSAR